MTPDDLIALGKRAVACKGFRWLRGMLRQDDYRYVSSGVWARWSDVHSLTTALHSPDQWPDLTDSATRGCLLTLVREAWGGDFEQVWLEWYPPLSRWGIQGGHAGTRSVLLASGPTEAEALVAALETAP